MGEHEEFRERVLTSLATQQEMLINILKQTENTTNRVSALEKQSREHDLVHARHDERKKTYEYWRDKLLTPVLAVICMALGSLVFLILQKTDIIDVSVVSPEQYDEISKTLDN